MAPAHKARVCPPPRSFHWHARANAAAATDPLIDLAPRPSRAIPSGSHAFSRASKCRPVRAA